MIGIVIIALAGLDICQYLGIGDGVTYTHSQHPPKGAHA